MMFKISEDPEEQEAIDISDVDQLDAEQRRNYQSLVDEFEAWKSIAVPRCIALELGKICGPLVLKFKVFRGITGTVIGHHFCNRRISSRTQSGV
eukprot:TRINITY_DN8593_c0_g1_i1.p2 TRINITY_DN8593_c0_g1~~TRINITY_DN8593_c0_g1_i1.p2  ORF type:complete len:94 (-),score=20.63 TRINITY_DN8593_c0_g1_i1:73-354(-)